MSSFKGSAQIVLNFGDTRQAKDFQVSIASSANSNDGFLAFGRSIASAEVDAFSADSTDITSLMIDSTSVDATTSILINTIQLELSHPGAQFSSQKCTLRFKLTLDNSSVVYAYFTRVQIFDSEV